MDFIEKIEELQQKPDHIRRRILVISVTSIMAVIIGIWLLLLGRSLATVDTKTEKEQKNVALTPFALLGGQIKESFQDLRKLFK